MKTRHMKLKMKYHTAALAAAMLVGGAFRLPASSTNLGRMGRLILRRVKGTRVALEAPGFGEVPARGEGPEVRLVGGPQELVLYLNGRRSGAEVDISGPDEAQEALAAAPLGF